ncbi:MAG: 2-oxoacid:acceptor oxidoreductase family protein [Candidatus Omnitrophica bacterium]|nr:2-oxoacid:acceptor oxidoreductase family protein [Candidatus Omnitrophota bacterium]
MGTERKTVNVLFYGIGGQGVLTAAEVCALAAMLDGYHVKKSEVKGMAQRGGSVESYVRFGSRVYSPLPLPGESDVIVCLHEEEYARMKDQLKPQGVDLFPYLAEAAEAVGDKKLFLNTYMLGVLSSFLDIKESSWLEALARKFKKEREQNRVFFLKGRAKRTGHDI